MTYISSHFYFHFNYDQIGVICRFIFLFLTFLGKEKTRGATWSKHVSVNYSPWMSGEFRVSGPKLWTPSSKIPVPSFELLNLSFDWMLNKIHVMLISHPWKRRTHIKFLKIKFSFEVVNRELSVTSDVSFHTLVNKIQKRTHCSSTYGMEGSVRIVSDCNASKTNSSICGLSFDFVHIQIHNPMLAHIVSHRCFHNVQNTITCIHPIKVLSFVCAARRVLFNCVYIYRSVERKRILQKIIPLDAVYDRESIRLHSTLCM